MDSGALDRWITRGPEFTAIVITQKNYDEWDTDLKLNERLCHVCEGLVGWIDYIRTDDSLGLVFVDFLRLDEDDEVNRCENCTHEDDWSECRR